MIRLQALTISMLGSDELGNLQLLQTDRKRENDFFFENIWIQILDVLNAYSLTSSGVMTPVSLNLDSCKGEIERIIM